MVSIHAPREGCDWDATNAYNTPSVSIHAPREGCDVRTASASARFFCFNSRTPGGVRLAFICISYQGSFVSIHAPREGCDLIRPALFGGPSRFNSRTPGGVRPISASAAAFAAEGFNSRTPGGVRPHLYHRVSLDLRVSIHAPREGCDPLASRRLREALVSIHAPREGCDANVRTLTNATAKVSIHAPREGCDVECMATSKLNIEFQFTHPGRGATGFHYTQGKDFHRFNSRTPGGVRPTTLM